MSPITVAVLGGTGNIGRPLVKALLSPQNRPSRVARVIVFTRDPSSAKAKELTALGAEAVQPSGEALTANDLKGVDVFINTSAATVPHETNDASAQAALEAGVKVYFPTGYGCDTRLSSLNLPRFAARYESAEKFRKLSEGRLKVIAVSPGAFIEWWITPFLGFDTEKGVFEAKGDPKVKISGTSEANVGQSLAELAILAANDPNSIPDNIHIAGDTKNYHEIAEIFSKETGQPIQVVGSDWATSKKETDEKDIPDQYKVFEYIRLAFAEGAGDFSKINDNELFNPGEKVFKWTTIADWAKETKGKPNPNPAGR